MFIRGDHDLRDGLIVELGLRVVFSSWISSWIFELDSQLDFPVGFSGLISSWTFKFDFQVDFRLGQCKM